MSGLLSNQPTNHPNSVWWPLGSAQVSIHWLSCTVVLLPQLTIHNECFVGLGLIIKQWKHPVASSYLMTDQLPTEQCEYKMPVGPIE